MDTGLIKLPMKLGLKINEILKEKRQKRDENQMIQEGQKNVNELE